MRMRTWPRQPLGPFSLGPEWRLRTHCCKCISKIKADYSIRACIDELYRPRQIKRIANANVLVRDLCNEIREELGLRQIDLHGNPVRLTVAAKDVRNI
jgi:hypothetical protein